MEVTPVPIGALVERDQQQITCKGREDDDGEQPSKPRARRHQCMIAGVSDNRRHPCFFPAFHLIPLLILSELS